MSDLAAALSVPGSGFRLDSRFGGTIAADLTMRRPNVAEGAYSEGYAKGFEDGTATAVAQAEQDSAARSRIELGLGRLAEEEERRFEERLREYYKNTAPLIGYYYAKGQLKTVDGMADIEDVTKQIEKLLKKAEEKA